MASKLNLDGGGQDIVLFAYSGKTMIGRLYNPDKYDVPSVFDTSSVIYTMLVNQGGTANFANLFDNYYIIDAPCQVQFDVVKQNTGTAKLTWKLLPYFYKNLVVNGETFIPFAFPKNQVCLSNIVENTMDNKLVQAYKELVQITK